VQTGGVAQVRTYFAETEPRAMRRHGA